MSNRRVKFEPTLAAGVVQIRRAYANGRVKHTKTRLSRRAAGDRGRGARQTPVATRQPAALPERTRRLPRRPQLQPPPWKPVQKAAGIEPLRELYDPAPHLRHLRTPRRRPGVRPLTVHGYEHRDDRPHYGHLAVDRHEHAVSLLDALALERAVDAGWPSNWRPVSTGSYSVSRHRALPFLPVLAPWWLSKSEAITTSAARRADEQELLKALGRT